MATRGSWGFFQPTSKDAGYFKLAFQSSDTGPWGLGQETLNFIHEIKKSSYKVSKLKHQIEKVTFTKDMPDDQWKLGEQFLYAVLAGKAKFSGVKNFHEGGSAHEYCWAINPWDRTLMVYVRGGETMVEIPWKYLPEAWPKEVMFSKEKLIEYCRGLVPSKKKKAA